MVPGHQKFAWCYIANAPDIRDFWNVTPLSLLGMCQRLRGVCSLLRQAY